MKSLFFILLSSYSFLAWPSLDLKTAEDLASRVHVGLQIKRYGVDIIKFQRYNHTSRWLPRLSLVRQGSKSAETPTVYSSFLRFQQPILNPWQWYQTREKLNHDSSIAQLQLAQERSKLLAKVRKQYFRVRLWQRKLKIAKENIAMLEDLVTISRLKYKRGLSDITSAERAKLQLQEQQAAIDISQQSFISESRELPSIGRSLSKKSYNLSTSLM